MVQYIDKSAVAAEVKRIEQETNYEAFTDEVLGKRYVCESLLSFLDTLEVKDPYEQCIQYSSVKDAIQAHAETYSFNIESGLFHQLTKEQQALWRKEIEQAVISGGEAGVELARDPRYEENVEVKEVEDNSLEKFKSLQHITGDLHRTLEDWGYAPNLYYFDGSWHVDWISCEEGDSIKDFTGGTAEAAIEKAYNWFNSTFCNS